MGDQAAAPVPREPITTDQVVFTEATPHQRILSWQLNGASWAPPLTIEQYVGRETTLSETELSANGGTKYYIVHPKDDPETIVSACEVTAKKALVGDRDGVCVVDAYSIASVFTNPRFRENGMASYLLRQVQQAVDRTTTLGALYSDIGRVYYTKLGWRDFRSPQALLSLPAAEIPRSSSANLPSHPVEEVALLDESNILALANREVASLQRVFREHAATRPDAKTHIAFLPTPAQFAWHFARAGYVCKTLRGHEVQHRGARTVDEYDSTQSPSWIAWDHDLREGKLKVLWLRLDIGGWDRQGLVEHAKRLLRAALAEARAWGLHKVLVWNPSEEVTAAAAALWREYGAGVSVVLEEREDGSIPSLRWQDGKDVEVEWERNEYYAWC